MSEIENNQLSSMSTEFNILVDTLGKLRRVIHQNPEVSDQEVQTAHRIKQFVKVFQPTAIIDKLGGNGMAVIFDSGNPGKTVMLRAELDALPILEKNDIQHKSRNKGVAHSCGHDGHMVMVAGMAAFLQQEPPESGRVILLFQPAEETGSGARKILADPRFKQIEPDYILALHNIPGKPFGQILCKDDIFSASVISLRVTMEGKTTHAAQPEHGVNPAYMIAEILEMTQGLRVLDPNREDFAQITPIHGAFGSHAYGTAAGFGDIGFTFRTWKYNKLEQLTAKVLKNIDEIAKRRDIGVTYKWIEPFHATNNDSAIYQQIMEAALDNGLDLHQMEHPNRWGEDFGLFTEKYPGAMFGLGSGEDMPDLHNPDYDFPDGLIEKGLQMYYQLVYKLLEVEISK